jgi:hypothetical protein
VEMSGTSLSCSVLYTALALMLISVLEVTVLRGVLMNATLYFIQLLFFYLHCPFALVPSRFILLFPVQKMKKTYISYGNNG